MPVKGSITDSFVGLPIESLICSPIIAAAKGQRELTAVYIDGIKKLAYKDGESGTANTIDMSLDRPVQNQDGTISIQKCNVKVPLISIVPVPAFLMDELVVDFNMEVKRTTVKETKGHAEISSSLSYKSWFGLDAQINGTVASDTSHRRETDSSATYHITARASQQSPSEGMAKLTSLFASVIEPIPAQGN